MARNINRLTATKVNSTKEPGMYADGGGLYLRIGPSGAKSWIFRYMLNGRSRDMGLGAVNLVSLSEARQAAHESRKLKHEGKDPIEKRLEGRKIAPTFESLSKEYIESHKAGWKNKKHIAQWSNTLKTYAYPHLGSKPVSEITVQHILSVLQPIWQVKTETASRVRMRMESILDYATAHGYRSGENPARWKGHLDKILPARSKIQKVKHHKAMPYERLPEFMDVLKNKENPASLALQFTILTAARTGETLGATWDEINQKERLWTVPSIRMKAGKEHKVPLSDAAIQVLNKINILNNDNGRIFPLSTGAMPAVLKRLKEHESTVHGFRSTFRDWAAEATNTPNEICEMALAHSINNKVESAYRRGDMLDKRRVLMNRWADFILSNKSKILQIGRG